MSSLRTTISDRLFAERVPEAGRRWGGLVVLMFVSGLAVSFGVGVGTASAGCGDHLHRSGSSLVERMQASNKWMVEKSSAPRSEQRTSNLPTKAPRSRCEGGNCDQRPASPVSPVRLSPPTRFDWAVFLTVEVSPTTESGWRLDHESVALADGVSASIERPPRS